MARTRMKGLAELEKKLGRTIPDAAKKAAGVAMLDGAHEMAELMYMLAPEDDGDLKRSIEVTGPGGTTPPYSQPGGSRKAGELEAIITAGNDRVRYPHLVEFGAAPHLAGGLFEGAQHPGAEAQPFFFPAYRALRRLVQGKASRAIGRAIRSVFGKGGR